MIANPELITIFHENGLIIKEGNGSYQIIKKGLSNKISYAISLAIGTSLIVFSLINSLGNGFTLAGVIFLVIPLITQRWKAPHEIIIEQGNSVTLNSGVTISRKIRLADIKTIEVDESILNSDASPFKDGHQDFIYNFKLITSDNTRSLFRLNFRKESTEEMQMVFNYLTSKLEMDK